MATYQDLGFIGNIQAATKNILSFFSEKLNSITLFFNSFISQENFYFYAVIFLTIVAIVTIISVTGRDKPDVSRNKQLVAFQGLYESRSLQIKPTYQYFNKNTITENDKNLVLLNTSYFAVKNAGFIGPKINGSFSPLAIKDAISIGARCFIFSIDYYKGDQQYGFAKPYYPCLLYRDKMGVIRSKNSGSIKEMMNIIADEGFNNRQSGSDPILVILDFKNTPDPITEKDNYLNFLINTANEISVLDKNGTVLKNIANMKFTNQSNPSFLFTQKLKDLKNKILIFTNVDTSIYDQPETLKLNLSPKSNLKMLTHAQIFTSSGSAIAKDPVTKKPKTGTPASIAKDTSEFWLQFPPDTLADARNKTNPTYSIISDTYFNNLPIESCEKLFNTIGVQIIPFQMYTTPKESEDFFNWWGPYAVKVRPKPVQFNVVIPVEPAPISKKLNANGGNPTPPQLIL